MASLASLADLPPLGVVLSRQSRELSSVVSDAALGAHLDLLVAEETAQADIGHVAAMEVEEGDCLDLALEKMDAILQASPPPTVHAHLNLFLFRRCIHPPVAPP